MAKPSPTPLAPKRVLPPEQAAAIGRTAQDGTPNGTTDRKQKDTPSDKVACFTKFMNVQEVIEFEDGSTFSFPSAHLRTADAKLIAKLRAAAKNPSWRINEIQEHEG